MQNDTNTNGYNQWFYFSILEAQANKKYTFKIVNFVLLGLYRKRNIRFLSMACSLTSFHWRKVSWTTVDGTWMARISNIIALDSAKIHLITITHSSFKWPSSIFMISSWFARLCLMGTPNSFNSSIPTKLPRNRKDSAMISSLFQRH